MPSPSDDSPTCADNLKELDAQVRCQVMARIHALLYQFAIHMRSAGEADRSELQIRRLSSLGDNSLSRFRQPGTLEDLDKAVGYRSQVVVLTRDDDPHKPRRLSKLGTAFLCRYEHLRQGPDIDKAVAYFDQAVQLTPEGRPDMLDWLQKLGGAYQCRFEHLDRISDIDKAVACRRRLVQLSPKGHSDYPNLLNSLGDSYMSRFSRLDNLSDINRAFNCQLQAVKCTVNDHADKPVLLNNLGITYRHRFDRLGELSDIMNAVACQSQAVQLTPDDCSAKSCWLINLGNSYQSRFSSLGNLEDLNDAIASQSQAVQLTPDGHATKSSQLTALGTAYILRFTLFGELPDANKAIQFLTRAVQLTPEGDTCALNNLGTVYMCRFERFGELLDINKAVEYLNSAVKLTPDGHPKKLGWLGNLGDSYLRRFQRLGNVADIDLAITHQSQVVHQAPVDHAHRAAWVNSLGISYLCRFERLDTVADIEKAIACQTEAVNLTPDGHSAKPKFLNGLGNAYMVQFQRLDNQSYLDQAIAFQTQAVQLTPERHVDKARRLTNLGNMYLCRFEHLGQISDVDQAVACQTQAAKLTPDTNADRPDQLGNLGYSYRCRFERLGDFQDVNKAINCQSQAVQLTPEGHANKPRLFYNLGGSYMLRYKRQGKLLDVEAACTSFQQAAQAIVSLPYLQLASARQWANSCSLLGISPYLAYQRGIDLLSQSIWLGMTIDQRYDRVEKGENVARESAAWAISVQAYDLAVEWLEEGRSIVWNQILHLRTPFDDLSTGDPRLAERLKDVAYQLEHAGSRYGAKASLTSSPGDMEKDDQKHRQLAMEWEQLLQQARDVPGFRDFLRPRKADELRLAAADGPMVIINTHQTRCDALIIRPDTPTIKHVPLESFSLAKSADVHAQLGSLVGHGAGRAGGFKRLQSAASSEKTFKSILGTLWLDVVKPVLDALDYTNKQPVDMLPHVTWCTTGALAFLPLHAAGLYDGVHPNTFDLVVSSYTPTLSALLARRSSTFNPTSGMLAVGQEHSQGLGNLPNTVQELSAIQGYAKAIPFLQLDGKQARVDTVVSAMDKYGCVHLACHAIQNRAHPAHSAFRLHDGDLTLENITARSFKNKGLAFLSACQTAMGDSELPDEAVHLAAGMLMAGYPSVIATMWSIYDVDGPEVAGAVYAELIQDGKMDYRGAARVLHKAVAGLRGKIGPDLFERWVPFIHIGV